jgi:hypothetical protein
MEFSAFVNELSKETCIIVECFLLADSRGTSWYKDDNWLNNFIGPIQTQS